MLVDKYELGKMLILLSSQYRTTGDTLSIDAYNQLIDGSITKDEYDKIHQTVGILFTQAIDINKEIAKWTAGSIEADLAGIENATENLRKAVKQIAKIKEIVNVAVDVCSTLGIVALAATTPTPASIEAAIKATLTIVKKIGELTAA